jgi:hypothetical protein
MSRFRKSIYEDFDRPRLPIAGSLVGLIVVVNIASAVLTLVSL